jgi:ADP-heptose:LPS heptosyltransferase
MTPAFGVILAGRQLLQNKARLPYFAHRVFVLLSRDGSDRESRNRRLEKVASVLVGDISGTLVRASGERDRWSPLSASLGKRLMVRRSGVSVDSMRRIDRLAGVPLCALATAVLSIWWWLRRKPARPVRRILFVELSEMGSTILADPAMRRARELAGAEIFFVIFAQNADSLKITGTVAWSNVFTIDSSSLWRLMFDTLAFLRWTRRNGIDTVIDLELFSRFTGLLTGLSGADRRVGFYRFHNEGLYRGEMLTHRVWYNPHIHIAKNFIALVESALNGLAAASYTKTIIGDEALRVSAVPPDPMSCDRIRSEIKALIPDYGISPHRLVLINPNASDMLPQRHWMLERYAELIRRILASHKDAFVLITGAPSERADAQRLEEKCASPRCAAFAGRTLLTDLPALYSLADVMVTNDSGPAHFAAATGLPTIVLFGPETPDLYRPLGNPKVIYAGLACSPCVSASNHRKSACTDNVCMRAISAEQVLRAVNQVLTVRLRESG